MSTVGLITEYNPFHNGHLYHINEARKITGANCVIAVMSGNYVQRGEPACIDKYTRTKMAINNGVDLVLNLPVEYATASAEAFAYGAVCTLFAAGCESICFGSECGDIDVLMFLADILVKEPFEYKLSLKEYLSQGYVYPKARQLAMSDYLASVFADDNNKVTTYASILESPNNILGIEYCKAAIRLKLPITIHAIMRRGSDFNSTQLEGEYSSATAIRAALTSSNNASFDELATNVPDNVADILMDEYNKTTPITLNDFSPMLITKLSEIIAFTPEKLCDYYDVSSELANMIISRFDVTMDIDGLINAIKNKQYTRSRISRALLHILLNITNTHIDKCFDASTSKLPYIRILGLNAVGRVHLNSIKNSLEIPLITKPAAYSNLLTYESYSTQLYMQVIYSKFNTRMKAELSSSPYISID